MTVGVDKQVALSKLAITVTLLVLEAVIKPMNPVTGKTFVTLETWVQEIPSREKNVVKRSRWRTRRYQLGADKVEAEFKMLELPLDKRLICTAVG